MAKTFNIWARIEVLDEEIGECNDLDPEVCEYKLLQTNDLMDVALYLCTVNESAEQILCEMEAAAKHQEIEL